MNKVLSKLLNPKKRIAGLDIGTSAIKFMEIEGDSLDNAKLISYVVEPIPREFLTHDGRIENMKGVADIIRSCWKKSKSTTKNVAISLSSSGVITRKAALPKLDNQEDIQNQVETEISNYLPEGMKLEDVMLDYYITQDNDQNADENDMLLVAAKKEKIDERIALVEMAGLIPHIVEVEQYSLQNMVRLMSGDQFNEKSILLLDCSAKVMRMFIFKNGQLVYNKDIDLGGDDFTNDIMNNLGVSTIIEAEKLKLENSNDETLAMIQKTFLMNYSSEFLRAFQYFTSFYSSPEIDEVILCGGVAGIAGIEEAFHNIIVENEEPHIRTSPYVARPLEQVAKGDKISLSKFSRDEAGLFLVTSLAIRQFLRQY